MRYPKVFSIAFVALLSNAISTRTQGQAIHQWLLDTVTAQNTYFKDCVMLDDNGFVIRGISNGDYFNMQRWNADGSFAWHRTGPQEINSVSIATDLISGPMNGLIASRSRETEVIYGDGTPATSDTLHHRVQVAWLDAQGAPYRVKEIRLTEFGSSGSVFYTTVIGTRLARLANGNVVLLSLIAPSQSSPGYFHLCRFLPNGDIAWNKKVEVHNLIWQSPSIYQGATMHDDGNNGIYIALMTEGPPAGSPVIMHFNQLGEQDWTRKLVYTNSGTFFERVTVSVSANGDPMLYTKISTTSDFGLLMRMNSSGSLIRADLYSIPNVWSSEDQLMEVLPNDEVLLTTNGKRHILHIAPQSEPINLYYRPDTLVDQRNRSILLGSTSSKAGRIAVLSALRYQHQIFGTLETRSIVEVYDASQGLEGCGWEIIPSDHNVVPTGLVVAQSENNVPVVELVVPLAVSDGEWTTTSLPEMGHSDLCTLFVGIEDAHSHRTTHMLQGTLVERSGWLNVTAPGKGFHEILDLNGRRLRSWNSTIEGQVQRVGADMLHPGMYFIRWTAYDATKVRSERFVVE